MLLSSGEGLTPPWWPLLEKEGHALFQAEGSEQAREMARDHHPELCILDLGCPEVREAYFELGKEGLSLPPSLALVPRDDLRSYEPAPGMDDFVVTPCSGEELLLRVRQVLRRHGSEEEGRVLHRGDLAIDLNKYEVWVGGRPVYFTYTEYELLKFLALSPGKVFTREVLLDRVWGYDYFGGTRTVDVHIRRLRSKIEDATHSFIDTVRNVGYRFKT